MTKHKQVYFRGLLTRKYQLGPYPMEKIKRVERPTTKISEDIQRFDEREHGFNRALSGDLGSLVARERARAATSGNQVSSSSFTC